VYESQRQRYRPVLLFFLTIVMILCVFSNVHQVLGLSQKEDIRLCARISIPQLEWYPKAHDFGAIQEGNLYQTSFDIWNNGTGDMPWSLQLRDPYVTAEPMSGSSSGEHGTVNVTINTTGLLPGDYEANVYLHSEGDYIFFTSFSITPEKLSYAPIQHDFGIIMQGNELQTSFDIWNVGKGTLQWTLHGDQNWISYYPTSGTSSGEAETITVTLNTTEIPPGDNQGVLHISSNGGNADFLLLLHINYPPDQPILSGPHSGYIKHQYTFSLIINDGDNDVLWYQIDWGDTSDNDEWKGPYPSGEEITLSHAWERKGQYTISVKTKDSYETESSWAIHQIALSKSKISGQFLQYLQNMAGWYFFISSLITG
jgi:hypothetical protein